MLRIPNLHKFDRFAIDTEATGLSILTDNAFGISISTPDGEDYYWDIRIHREVVTKLHHMISSYRGTIIAHHASFDWHMLRRAGVCFNPRQMQCTMIRAALIDEHLHSYSLDNLAKKYISAQKDDTIYQKLADIFGGLATRNVQMKNLHRAPVELVRPYAKRDTQITLGLFDWQAPEIERQNLGKILKLEMDLLEVVCDLEFRGVKVDIDRAEQTRDVLAGRIDTEQKQLDRLIGHPVNVNPSGSLTGALVKGQDKKGVWKAIDGTSLPQTPTGKAKLDAEVLRSIKHPAAELVLSIRKSKKLKDTFIEGHILSYQHNGRVHSHINQTKTDTGSGMLGTGTGRLSMSAPALQQIHKRDKKMSSIIRSIFIPEAGEEWSSLDYSQADLRFFAHYTQSPNLVGILQKDPDADIHQITADLMGIDRNPGPDGGANAKQMGLAQVFGMGPGLLAKEMGLPFTEEPAFWDESKIVLKPGPEAIALAKLYHQRITGAKEFAKDVERLAKAREWIVSIMGRKMHFPKGYFAYKGAGYLYQSGTAEAIKTKMVQCWRAIKEENLSIQMLLSVHDELNFSQPKGDPSVKIMQEIMQDFSSEEAPFLMRVPMRVDPGIGINWYEAGL